MLSEEHVTFVESGVSVLVGTRDAKLRENGRIALTFTRPYDHRSMQLKGKAVAFRPAGEAVSICR